MSTRVNVMRKFPAASRALNALSDQVRDHALELEIDIQLIELVKIRASQINKCAACLSTHVVLAENNGETSQRLGSLVAWRENDLFSDREKAALELTEWVTLINEDLSPDVNELLRDFFSDEQIAALIWVIVVINSFNRISIVSGVQP